MRRSLSCFALSAVLSLSSLPVAAQSMSDDTCALTAEIVTKAQEMRMDGKNSRRTVRQLTRDYADQSDGIREKAIPALVEQFVFAQPESALDQDLGAFWKETCLNTDVSSVLGDS